MKQTLLLLLLLLGGTSHTALAQDAFERIRFTLTGNHVISGTTIKKSWEPTAGIGFEISTPHYFGNLEAGYRYIRYNEFHFEDSGFNSHYVFGGWYYSHSASPELNIASGIRLGNTFILHDHDVYYDDYRFSRDESEFTFEMNFRIQYETTRNTEIYVGAAYNRTLFNIPFSAFIGTVGITAKFESPSWLKRFLK